MDLPDVDRDTRDPLPEHSDKMVTPKRTFLCELLCTFSCVGIKNARSNYQVQTIAIHLWPWIAGQQKKYFATCEAAMPTFAVNQVSVPVSDENVGRCPGSTFETKATSLRTAASAHRDGHDYKFSWF